MKRVSLVIWFACWTFLIFLFVFFVMLFFAGKRQSITPEYLQYRLRRGMTPEVVREYLSFSEKELPYDKKNRIMPVTQLGIAGLFVPQNEITLCFDLDNELSYAHVEVVYQADEHVYEFDFK